MKSYRPCKQAPDAKGGCAVTLRSLQCRHTKAVKTCATPGVYYFMCYAILGVQKWQIITL